MPRFTFPLPRGGLSLPSARRPRAFLPLGDAKHFACCQPCLEAGLWDRHSLPCGETPARRGAHPEPGTVTCHPNRKGLTLRCHPTAAGYAGLKEFHLLAAPSPPNPPTSQPVVYHHLCCETLPLSGLCWEHGERAAIKANSATKMQRFLLGVKLKAESSLTQFSSAAGTSYWGGGRWKYHLSEY